ncbi:flagellar protein FliT [Rummeliibacillus suwonensis]|uniref:flagellar protein FliT n=1 Tax=Rummeliibacillus suwonensis TaxID=1306154 RepID=UPI002897FCA4|nr:flagellar protein FliT [Rummeliibacillus suwonensis]
MDQIQELLQISAQLYKHLTQLPADKERDAYIQKMDDYLDKRGIIIDELKKLDANPIIGHPFEKQLRELDKGIIERLKKAKAEIAQDMKNLQKSKTSERRYVDPYASVRVMDGTYFDGRK